LLTVQVSGSLVSQKLCGSPYRARGIDGGLCKSVLESTAGELPMCPEDDRTRDAALAVYDLFADKDWESMLPEAANMLKSVVACGVVGNVWNANLTFYTLPGMTGPCGFDWAGLGTTGTCTGFLFTDNPYGDEYRFWTGFIAAFTATSQSPDCYDYNNAAFHGANRDWGGRPFCSFYTDLSPRFPSCSEVARFRRMTEDDYEDVEARIVHADHDYPSPVVSPAPGGIPAGGYNYTFEYCSQPNTVKNPYYMNIYEMVSCDEWTLCDNQDVNPKYGYGHYYNMSQFPICNPSNCNCNCGGGQGQGTGGSFAGRDYSCGGQGQGTGGSFAGRDYSCGGQGQGTGGSFAGRGLSEVDYQGVPVQNKWDMKFLAETFELITQLDVVGSLQAADPWQEIFGRLCSCACGPSF